MNKLDINNFIKELNRFLETNSLDIKKIYKEIGCSKATINRVLNKETIPTEKLINEVNNLISIGYENYKNLKKGETSNKDEQITAGVTGAMGVGAIVPIISSSGTVGLSGAGITSGLAVIGGGTMLGGLLMVAVLPTVTCIGGYHLAKKIKKTYKNSKIKREKIDSTWEILNN